MPTLPLFIAPDVHPLDVSPDAAHVMAAPGGYEWWHFDAEDAGGGVQLAATFYDGCPFHPGYLRAHARYLRRPTRVPPAVPVEYPCVAVAAYVSGRPVVRRVVQYPPDTLRASDGRPELRVGPHSLTATAGGALQLAVAGTASLSFRPSCAGPAVERRVLSRELTGADHHWVLPAAAYEVEGTITVPPDGGTGTGTRDVAFRGRGYHDHHFGSGPFAGGVRRWLRGRVTSGDDARAFHAAWPLDARRPVECHLTLAGNSAAPDAAGPTITASDERRASWGLRYPTRVKIQGGAGGNGLRLANGRVLDCTPFSVRLTYEATGQGDSRPAQAFCDLIYPQRLRSRVFGRLVERSIEYSDRRG